MAKKLEKTNAARLLDKAGISYRLIPYEFDENDLAAHHVAESLGQSIEQVFKTLVLHGDRTGYIVCVVPGNTEVDLKALAKASSNKKVEMIAMKDLLPRSYCSSHRLHHERQHFRTVRRQHVCQKLISQHSGVGPSRSCTLHGCLQSLGRWFSGVSLIRYAKIRTKLCYTMT